MRLADPENLNNFYFVTYGAMELKKTLQRVLHPYFLSMIAKLHNLQQLKLDLFSGFIKEKVVDQLHMTWRKITRVEQR